MYMELSKCINCSSLFAAMQCHYCKLLLYCSSHCAIQSSGHPCHLAYHLLNTEICVEALWPSSVALPVLDQLFIHRSSLSFKNFNILIQHNIPNSERAFNYLWHRVSDFFVWPHEKEIHLNQIRLAAVKLHACYPIINPHFHTEGPFFFQDYIGLLSPFAIHNADKFLCLLSTQRLVNILLDPSLGQFEFLILVAQHLSLPLLYQFFDRLKKMQITRDNSSLFKSQEGAHHVVPPLNINDPTWKKATEVQLTLRLPRGFTFSKNKVAWSYAQKQFQLFKNRKDFLLFLCLAKNKYLSLDALPAYQDWSWCTAS